ncbi:hypothetical protein O3S80_50725 [Streptomyces sp. Lzd4kr]|nr:hypothetical protein [Streptomyces sp. Lzd4kr]
MRDSGTEASSLPGRGQPKTLATVMSYDAPQVVHKFLEFFQMSYSEAEDLFGHLKKWLWFCAMRMRQGESSTITHELLLIDEMWHCFILFTREYAEFCDKYLGGFVHHAPTTKDQKDRMSREISNDRQAFMERRQGELRSQCEAIAGILDAQTLFTWYVEFPRRYGWSEIQHIRRYTPSSPSYAYQRKLDAIASSFNRV